MTAPRPNGVTRQAVLDYLIREAVTAIPRLSLADYLARLPGRCTHGFAAIQHPDLCACVGLAAKDHGQAVASAAHPDDRAPSEWDIFTRALREAAVGGVVRANDVRPLIRGRIYHKRIGRFYTRAEAEGLLVEIRREPSKDSVGRNTHHTAGVYELRSVA